MSKKDREEHFSEKEALLFHAQGKPGKIETKNKNLLTPSVQDIKKS